MFICVLAKILKTAPPCMSDTVTTFDSPVLDMTSAHEWAIQPSVCDMVIMFTMYSSTFC